MLGVSGLLTSTSASADGTAPPPQPPPAGGGDVPAGGEEAERNSGGNRWPRQETLALLRIRSEMDLVFRDSSFKGPLWEEVSRKLAELGYHRSAKKCKEKFENVYKYHRRTKDGRASKADGKTYRFFDQLEAFENSPVLSLPPPPLAATPITMAMPMRGGGNAALNHPIPMSQSTAAQNHITVTAAAPAPALHHPSDVSSLSPLQPLSTPPPTAALNQYPQGNNNNTTLSNPTSSSSSTSSDEDIHRRHRRKRKWKEYFERLMRDVIDKQEELQKKFLETLENRERERMAREEGWRVQEMARMNREHDLLVQERSMAAAKDATIIAFLQKITEQQNKQTPDKDTSPQLSNKSLDATPQPQPPPLVQPPATTTALMPIPSPVKPQAPPLPAKMLELVPKPDNGGEGATLPASSSRWPKEEIEALIRLRTNLDLKYQENVPKGPLWEEISAGMRKLGYNRNSRRCKEKWENINKYFKKVKESNKKRAEDSKTCPYFHQLEALYKEKAKNEAVSSISTSGVGVGFGFGLKPENNPTVAPNTIMAPQAGPAGGMSNNNVSVQDQEDNVSEQSMEEDDNEYDNEDDDDDEADAYEFVPNKQSSSMAAATAN